MKKLILIFTLLFSFLLQAQIPGVVASSTTAVVEGAASATLPSSNLIAYYTFDSDATDFVGNVDLTEITGGNTVTFTATGKSGNCATFDGVDGTGLEATASDFVFGNPDVPFSVSFMLKFDTGAGAGGDVGSIFSKRIVSSGTTNEYQLMHYNAVWFWAVFDDDTTGNIDQQSAKEYIVGDYNTWEHWVLTYNGNGGVDGLSSMKMYRNGVDVTGTGILNGTFTQMDQGTAKFRLGDPEWSGTFELDGAIDGFGIWDKKLSPAEVTIIYDIQNAGNEIIFDADYQNIIDQAVSSTYTIPSAQQQLIQNQLVLDLKSNSIWSKLDALWIPANDGSEEFGYLNWIAPTTFEVTQNGTVNFTSNRGVTANSTTDFLETNFIPSSDGTNYLLNTASTFVYVDQPSTLTTDQQTYIGAQGTTAGYRTHLTWSYLSDKLLNRVNSNQFVDGTTSLNPANSFLHINRSTSTEQSLWADGALVNSDPDASASVPNVELYILGENNNGTFANYTDATISIAGVGGDLDTEAATLGTLMNDYINDINNLYSQDNAASRWPEVDATTGWVADQVTLTSDSSAPQDGAYNLKAVATEGNYDKATYSWTAVAGDEYNISWYSKKTTGTEQRIWFVGFDTNPFVNVTETSWTYHTVSVTATASGTVTIWASAIVNELGSIGDDLEWDKMSIVKTN
jgi:hypothetical protein